MAPSAISQRRTHNVLLLQKLLNSRDGASPFTLILDTLVQSATPVVKEFTVRAKTAKSRIIIVSFRTLRRPENCDVFIKAHGKSLSSLAADIKAALLAPSAGPTPIKSLIIIDTVNPLASTNPSQLPAFLSSFIGPTTSLLATYNTDVPVTADLTAPYAPDALTTLLYLATAILRVSSLSHVLESKKARDKSLPQPGFGLGEGREGVLVGLESRIEGVVLEMEVRRKSGRGIKEFFVLGASEQKICLLDDHPLYRSPEEPGQRNTEEDEGQELTFSLGLTEKQKKDREGIVLPYFDAQKDIGSGEGGRILYDMGREDDWDEEEDEI